MVFSSAIFIFIFLPFVMISYQFLHKIRTKNIFLLIVSFIFYAFGQLSYIPLFLFSIFINYAAGRALGTLTNHRRLVVAISVAANLLVLGIFKYADFVVGTINDVTNAGLTMPNVILPVGISFFTFQGMSYVIDAYREPHLSSKSFLKVALYIAMFPQLVAGPIVIFSDVADQIDHRETSPQRSAMGIRRFIVGLSKKLFFANTLGAAVDQIYSLSPDMLDSRLAWMAAIFYATQIYFDFSGYSDMAIGMGHMFGFTFLENFNYPYISSSMKEFWRRWHISLSSWFRSYLYIPLGGNRKGKLRTVINKLIVFFATGLWHGASWNFVIWGLWNGLFMILEDIIPAIAKIPKFIRLIGVLLITVTGFVVFRAENLTQAGEILSQMFSFDFTAEAGNVIGGMHLALLASCAAAVAATPVSAKLRGFLSAQGRSGIRRAAVGLSYVGAAVMFVLCIMNLASNSFNPFIYYQF